MPIEHVKMRAGRTRGDADDYNPSSLFRGDGGVDAKLGRTRVSSLARGSWVERRIKV